MAEERERERETETERDRERARRIEGSGGKWLSVAGRGRVGETDVPQKKQTAATDSMEGISPLRDDGRARCSLGPVPSLN